MQRLACSLTLFLLLSSTPAHAQNDPAPTELATVPQKMGYAMGRNVASNLKQTGVAFDVEAFVQGVRDTMAGKAGLLTVEQTQQVMIEFDRQAKANAAARQKILAEKHSKEGSAFLAANTKNDGVKSTPSGLQYKILKPGSGATPKATSHVRVHYEGRLIDGTVFDSSFKRGEPVEFPVNGVIAGWTEALQLMQEGAEWKLYIPSTLGYGMQGAGDLIPPGATLVFKVQLIGVHD